LKPEALVRKDRGVTQEAVVREGRSAARHAVAREGRRPAGETVVREGRRVAPEAVVPQGDLWPPGPAVPTVLLLDVPTSTDRQILDSWLSALRASVAEDAKLRVAHTAGEAASLAQTEDASIAPVRVAWLPPGRDGDRRWRTRDVLKLCSRIGLSAGERERILSHEPDRCRIVVGEPARLSDLRSRMHSQSAPNRSATSLRSSNVRRGWRWTGASGR
jgi:hypothetical protein